MLGEAILGAALAVVSAAALAWKWQLGIRRSSLATALLAAPGAIAVALLDDGALSSAVAVAVVWLVATLVAAGVLAYRFRRDPERTPPQRNDVIVSPADGEVVYVRHYAHGRLPTSTKLARESTLQELTRTPLHASDAVAIGIALSFLDVHVTRSPLAGQIVHQSRYPGRFASLRRPEAVFENERATIVIERGSLQLAVVLIASRLVRRIVTFLREGEDVALGQRIGAIRFGSQVDLVLLAPEVTVAVEVGQRVVAGETIVAVAGAPAQAYRGVSEEVLR